MAAFGGLILTNKGRALQAKVQAGAPLHFNRIGIGDGNLGSQQISDLNALISEKKSLAINKLKTQTGGKAIIGGVLSNQDVTVGFYFREIGFFAQDPDVGEILYCYANAGAGAEYIPAAGGPDVVEKQIDVVVLTANAATVTANIASGIYALAVDVGDMSTVPTESKVVAGAITELFQSGVDGKNQLEAAVIAKEGTVSKQGPVATFDELEAGIMSIPVGPDTSDATATAADILSGKTAYGAEGTKIIGTIPNRTAAGNVAGTAAGSEPGRVYIQAPYGFYNGGNAVYFDDPDFNPANWPDKINIFGMLGIMPTHYVGDGFGPNLSHFLALELFIGAVSGDGKNYVYLRPATGAYDGLTWTLWEVPNLLPQNIRNGVQVGNLVGTLEPKYMASGTVQSVQSVGQLQFTIVNPLQTIYQAYITVPLSFRAEVVIAWYRDFDAANVDTVMYARGRQFYPGYSDATTQRTGYINSFFGYWYKEVDPLYVNESGFRLPVGKNNAAYNYIAIG